MVQAVSTTDADPRVCRHERTEVRAKSTANGGRMLAAQCLDCGNVAGKWLPKSSWPDNPPPWDETLRDRVVPAALESVRAAEREARTERWFADYAVYLKSEAWTSLRRRVQERAKDTCEGCRLRPGKHCHHLTYAHRFNELLYELVWLCVECHEKAHGRAP